MNRNDVKAHRSKKGLIDLNKTKVFPVHHQTDLLTFLCEKIPNQSRKNIQRIIANHQVAVNGAPVSLFLAKLYPDDEVIVSWNRIQKRQRHDLPINYEDEDIIAINKPSGLLSVASDREKGRTAYRLVSDYITAKKRDARIYVVHRLDEDTSGVLIFAKKFEVREALQNHWQEIVKTRAYYAIVEPSDIEDHRILKDYLGEDKVTFNVYVTKDRVHGKLAVTEFQKIASNKRYALLDVHISSGRKNQIRVQLGNIGHHVIGDDKYGEPSNPLKRLGLHAYELELSNPINGKRYILKAPMPEEFKSLFGMGEKKVEKQTKERRPESYGGKGKKTHR